MKIKIRTLKKVIREAWLSSLRHEDVPYDPAAGAAEFGHSCPQCGGENTSWNDQLPAISGNGRDESLYCKDCKKSFSVDPLKGGSISIRGRKF